MFEVGELDAMIISVGSVGRDNGWELMEYLEMFPYSWISSACSIGRLISSAEAEALIVSHD